MTKEEILKLHELSEKEQSQWLIKNDVLLKIHLQCNQCQYRYESLAECAFRMRYEYLVLLPDVPKIEYVDAQAKIYEVATGRNIFDDDEDKGQIAHFWIWTSQSIHWIQAALLAKLEEERGTK